MNQCLTFSSNRKDAILDLSHSDEPIYVLGVQFSYNCEAIKYMVSGGHLCLRQNQLSEISYSFKNHIILSVVQ